MTAVVFDVRNDEPQLERQYAITKTAFAYLRVSTEEQTVENQRMAIKVFAARQGYNILDFFEDPATSGKIPAVERKGFKEMLGLLNDCKVDAIIIYELSRVGRTFWDTLDAVRLVEKRAPLVSCSDKESFLQNTEPSFRNIMISFLTWAADREREILVQRTKDGLLRAKAQGKQIGRREITIDPNDITFLLQHCKSKREVAKALGVSGYVLYRHLRQMQLLTNDRTVDANELLDLIDKRVSFEAIARELDISGAYLKWCLQRLYIPPLGGVRDKFNIVKYRPGIELKRPSGLSPRAKNGVKREDLGPIFATPRKGRPTRRFSPQEIEWIKEQKKRGVSNEKIARALHVNRNTLKYRVLNNLEGYNPNPGRKSDVFTNEQLDWIKDQRLHDVSKEKIAAALGVSKPTLYEHALIFLESPES